MKKANLVLMIPIRSNLENIKFPSLMCISFPSCMHWTYICQWCASFSSRLLQIIFKCLLASRIFIYCLWSFSFVITRILISVTYCIICMKHQWIQRHKLFKRFLKIFTSQWEISVHSSSIDWFTPKVREFFWTAVAKL